ncbi:MAG: phosphotransferase [Microthrixaceae bacterium]
MSAALPDEIAASIGGHAEVVEAVASEPVRPSTGAATRTTVRLRVHLGSKDGNRRSTTLIRKELRPVDAGRHAALAEDPRHWAYWLREAEAYQSGLLPSGPGLRAPKCFGVFDESLFLEAVRGPQPTARQAAEALASWQVLFEPPLDRPWLATDQIGRRLAASDLDWNAIDADARAVELWNRRGTYCERLNSLPKVLSHGDYSVGNLVVASDEIVAFDWATFGWEPVGFDLAHLALSTAEDPMPAYRAAGLDADVAANGFRCALVIIGASRVHWMVSRSMDVPSWYVDFLWEHRPPLAP